MILICTVKDQSIFIHNWDYDEDVLLKTFEDVSLHYSLTEKLSAITCNTRGEILL